VAPTDRSWLSPAEEKRYISGRWVLIFESGAPPDLRIKIGRQHADAYFSRGIEIEVTPDTSYLSDRVAQEVQENRRRYDELVQAVSSGVSGCLELADGGALGRVVYFAHCVEQRPLSINHPIPLETLRVSEGVASQFDDIVHMR